MAQSTLLVMAAALAAIFAKSTANATPAERRGIEVGATGEFLWGPFSTLSGPWLGAGPSIDFRWASPFHIRTRPLIVLAHTTRTAAGYPDGKTDESTLRIRGLLVRILPSVDLGPAFVARLGPVGAGLLGSYTSSLCGDESYSDVAAGASAELAVRFGGDSQLELGGQFDFIAVTPPRCKNQPPPPSAPFAELPPRNEAEDNVGFFVGATVTYLFLP